jgi:hypothetical protein
MSQLHGGKGSKMRPVSDRNKFNDNWDRIFGKKEPIVDEDGTVHDKCGTPDCCSKCAAAGEHLHKEIKVPEK